MGYYWAFLLLPAFFGSCSGNCGEPPRLDYGTLDSAYLGRDNFSVGENVSYSCQPGYITAPGTRKVITCLSTSAWSTPDVFCTRRSCGIPEDTANGQVHINDTLFGSRVYYTCNVGYNMINKVNYRDCLADGTWSGAPPACEVQTCPPPFAITDGSFEPQSDEYNYQDSVTYKCNNSSLSLIGEKSISCTAHGNWSSDPPKCKVVECKSPDVANSEKLSGFTGPYNLNSAVSFKCVSGYTMSGASSVRCNVSSEWDPPLPTCSRGGSGAIVGGVIGGIIGILIAAAIIYATWFRRKKGDDYVAANQKKPDSSPSSSPQTPKGHSMKELEAQATP